MFEVSKIIYLAKTNTNRYNECLSNMLLLAKIDHFGYSYHETIKYIGTNKKYFALLMVMNEKEHY